MQTILIVDDEKTNHALVCRAFTKNKIGNPLVFFLDGHKLMDYLTHMHHNRYLPPAFILLDLNMADMHGKEVIQALKEHPLFGCIPVIVFSSEDNPGEIAQCYLLGANCYLIQPLLFEDLVTQVAHLKHFWLQTASLPVTNAGRTYKYITEHA